MGHQSHVNQRNVKGAAESLERKERRNVSNIPDI
jgi:hypothetical protein